MNYGEDTNLLEETLRELAEHGKTTADVRWVGTDTESATWDEFAPLADGFYYSGFGGEEVVEALLVVGDDWWLERHTYDGSEWWEFKTLPLQPEGKPLSRVFCKQPVADPVTQ